MATIDHPAKARGQTFECRISDVPRARPFAHTAAYLDAVLEDGDPDLLKAALGDIARAKGMTEIAQTTGLGRANLYKALSPDGNPEFATVVRVLNALGLRLSVAA